MILTRSVMVFHAKLYLLSWQISNIRRTYEKEMQRRWLAKTPWLKILWGLNPRFCVSHKVVTYHLHILFPVGFILFHELFSIARESALKKF